jgi:hypothetical protein
VNGRIGRLIGLSLVALALPARASERPVTVAVERCPEVSEAALRALMRAEIGGLLLDGEDPGAERVLVSCEGELASLAAGDPDGGPALVRSVSLAGFPADARPRLLALVAVELVASRRPELRQRLERRETPPATVRKELPVAATPPPPPALRLLAGAGARVFVTPRGLPALTAGLRLERGLGRLELAADAEVGWGRRTLELGELEGRLASAGAALRLGDALGPSSTIAAGLGGRFGVVRLAGAPARPEEAGGRAVVRPWAGPFATVALGWGRGHACAAVSLEGGYTVVGARGLAGDSLAAAVTGPWLGATFSAGWQR